MSLKVENLFYTYMKGTPFEKEALNNVSLEIGDGEFVGIIGHTGCGKSTLVQHFNGLLKPEEGRVFIDGELMNKKSLKEMRKKVGMVFQYPEYQLFEETVYKDIAFGLKNEKLSKEEERERVLHAARITGLEEDLLEKSVFELSGGQKRRAAIAGVVVMRPEILVLDEPAAGLDPEGRETILDFARRICDEDGVSVVLVSHSMEDIARVADRVIVMNDGTVEMEGTPEEIFSQSTRLEEIGLTAPQISKLFDKLSQEFPQIPRKVFTVEKAADILEDILKGGAK